MNIIAVAWVGIDYGGGKEFRKQDQTIFERQRMLVCKIFRQQDDENRRSRHSRMRQRVFRGDRGQGVKRTSVRITDLEP